jgi:hypothetical protein
METTLIVGSVAAIPLVIGLVAVLRQTGMPVAFAPLSALVLGVILSLATAFATADTTKPLTGQAIVIATIVGLAWGLSASGLYSGTKTTIEAVKQ